MEIGYYIIEFKNGVITIAEYNEKEEWWMIGVDFEVHNPVKIHKKVADMCDGKPVIDTESKCNKHIVNGWHLFSEQKPTEGDNIEVYYDDRTIINVDWQDYLYNDKEFKHMRFWRACR